MKRFTTRLILAAIVAGGTLAEAQAIRENEGFYTRQVPRNDDESSGLESLGFTINLFGKIRDAAYVNNNGNLTFDEALATFTPFGLLGTEREIIAPFFADVDTRPQGSELVTFGQDFVNGHRAFAANFVNVGYYSNHTDKLNSFQVVLIEREDQGFGDFDIEFNYAQIRWETGDASGGVNGFGGTPAAVGWSNGTDTAFELPGSLTPGAFLDGGPYSLVLQSITGAVVTNPDNPQGTQGRLVFRARDGVINPGLTITGGQFPDGTVGVPYSSQLGVAGADPPYTWDLEPDVVPPPGLTLTSSGVLSGTPEAAGTYSFTIEVSGDTEDGRITTFERGSITIRPPALQITNTCPMPDATVGMPYSYTLGASGSTGGYQWSADPSQLPSGIGLDPAGELAGTPHAPGTYIINLAVASSNDEYATPAQQLCRLNVNPAAIQLATSCELPRATEGIPFSVGLGSVGGFGPYEYELIDQLPVGVNLLPNGTITGTPGFYGLYFFKVAVTDAQSARVVHDCSLIVDPRPFEISACPLPTGTTGVPYTTSLPSGFVWSYYGDFPAGLTLNPNGEIGGTPMEAGANHFTIYAANSSGEQSSQACSLTVERGALGVHGCPAPSGRVGELYTTSLSGLGGFSPYTFSPQGTLPPGLRLTSSGQITGTPAVAGTFPFTVSMRDAAAATVAQACSITIEPSSLRFTNACPLPDGFVGQDYEASLAAAGGTGDYTFVLNGFLPAGLEMAPDGTITGVPSRIGGRTFSVAVFEQEGPLTHSTCSIAIRQPELPEISLADLPEIVPPATSDFSIGIELAEPHTAGITGRLVMDVTPDTASSDATANSSDPRLTFSNGQREAVFTIPAGATSATVGVASTGTVASTVEVGIEDLRSAGVAIEQHPSRDIFQIPAMAPSVSSVCYVRTEQGLRLELTGISSTRELSHAVLTIPALASLDTTGLEDLVPEFYISDEGKLRVDLDGVSGAYFGSAINVRSGGAFSLSVAVPVDTTELNDDDELDDDEDQDGDGLIDLGEVRADIFNTIGAAGDRNVPLCP